MSFYFSRIASALRRSKNNIIRMKQEYEQYKKFLEKENPEIYKKKEKVFGFTQEENDKSPQEKMAKNPFYWYHQLKQKALDIFSPKENYKLLDKANTELEKEPPNQSKVKSTKKLDPGTD